MGIATTSPAPTNDPPAASDKPAAAMLAPIGGPVSVAWREGTLTRAEELEALCGWVRAKDAQKSAELRQRDEVLASAIRRHLVAARQAAHAEKLEPR